LLVAIALTRALVASLVARFLLAIGAFSPGRSRSARRFRPISGFQGAEDIAIDHERQVAYAPLFQRRTRTPPRGTIRGLDLNDPGGAEPLGGDLTGGRPEAFGPRGVDLQVDSDGTRRLFVVNNRIFLTGEAPCVEIFRIVDKKRLEHERTVTSPLFVSGSGIAAAGPAQFYLTNDFCSRRGSLEQMLDIYLLRRSGDVVYHDGREARRAAGPYIFPNGIALSPDGRFLVVGELLGCRLRSFSRDPATGALEPLSTRRLRGVVKAKFDDRGRLYVATRVNSLKFEFFIARPSVNAPGALYRFAPGPNGDPIAGDRECVLLTTGGPEAYAMGSRMPGLSVAAASGDRLLLGSVFEDHVWEAVEPGPSEA
jgi:arylesterase/paraoxonase